LSCSSKSSPRKSSAPADLSSQSFNPCKPFRPQSLSHSLPTPTLWDSSSSYPLEAPPHMGTLLTLPFALIVLTNF
jgi:hypothetical protein